MEQEFHFMLFCCQYKVPMGLILNMLNNLVIIFCSVGIINMGRKNIEENLMSHRDYTKKQSIISLKYFLLKWL